MESELKPCPFCGGTDVNLHHSARAFMSWVTCKSCGLDAPSETGVTDEEAITYWNTRPAPAATDTGLVTVEPIDGPKTFICNLRGERTNLIQLPEGDYVTRSQAEELLSEKDVIIRSHLATIATLNSDNTALAAQNKRLEDYAREATKALTGLSGGGSENYGKPIGELYPADLTFCVERIRERYVSKVELKRLEAKLSAAEKALEPFADIAEWDIGDSEADDDIYRPMEGRYAVAKLIRVGDLRKARAVLRERE